MEIRSIAVLALLVLSGCASAPGASSPASSGQATAAATPSAGPHLPWTLSGCRELTAFFDADPAAVQVRLPPGFTAGGGTVPGRTTIGMDAFPCSKGGAVKGEIDDVSYASFWAVATPPAALKGNVTQWYAKWMALVNDPDGLGQLQALKAPVAKGSVVFADNVGLPTAGTVCTITIDGIGTATITMGPEASPGPVAGGGGAGTRLREFTTAGADGKSILVWEATLTQKNAALGTGTLQVPAGTALAQIVGSTTIPVLVGDSSGGGLSDGTITMG